MCRRFPIRLRSSDCLPVVPTIFTSRISFPPDHLKTSSILLEDISDTTWRHLQYHPKTSPTLHRDISDTTQRHLRYCLKISPITHRDISDTTRRHLRHPSKLSLTAFEIASNTDADNPVFGIFSDGKLMTKRIHIIWPIIVLTLNKRRRK